MAAIYKTTGATADGGYTLSLEAVEERLRGYECVYRGTEPPSIAPATAYPTYVIVEVSEIDAKTPKFPKSGYYFVKGLQVSQASFLFNREPVRTGMITVRGWGSFEHLTARATAEPDQYRITYDNHELGTVEAETQGELLEEASKLYRKRFPNAP